MSVVTPPEEREAFVTKVIERISQGQYLRGACKEFDPPKDPATMLAWINSNEEWAKQYARARVSGYCLRLEDMEEDSDALYIAAKTGQLPDPVAAVQAFKARTDVKKWNAAKFAKGMFGDSTAIELSGSVKTGDDFDLSKLTTEELAAWRVLQSKAASNAPSDS